MQKSRTASLILLLLISTSNDYAIQASSLNQKIGSVVQGIKTVAAGIITLYALQGNKAAAQEGDFFFKHLDKREEGYNYFIQELRTFPNGDFKVAAFMQGDHSKTQGALSQFNANGVLEWTKEFEDPEGLDHTYVSGLAFVNESDFLTVGYTKNNQESDLTITYFNNTHIQWRHALDISKFDRGYSITLNGQNGFSVSGNIGSNDTNYDMLLTDFDFEGEATSIYTLKGPYNSHARKIVNTTDNGIIIATHVYAGQASSYDIVVIKLNATRDIQWQKKLGGESSEFLINIDATSDGGVTGIGHTYSFGQEYCNIIWFTITSDGELDMAKVIGDKGPDLGFDVKATRNNSFAITGIRHEENSGFGALFATFDHQGNTLNASLINGTNVYCGITIDDTYDENYLMGGYVYDYSSGKPSPSSFVAKLDGNGSMDCAIPITIKVSDIKNSLTYENANFSISQIYSYTTHKIAYQESFINLKETVTCGPSLAPTAAPSASPTQNITTTPIFTTSYSSSTHKSTIDLPYKTSTSRSPTTIDEKNATSEHGESLYIAYPIIGVIFTSCICFLSFFYFKKWKRKQRNKKRKVICASSEKTIGQKFNSPKKNKNKNNQNEKREGDIITFKAAPPNNVNLNNHKKNITPDNNVELSVQKQNKFNDSEAKKLMTLMNTSEIDGDLGEESSSLESQHTSFYD